MLRFLPLAALAVLLAGCSSSKPTVQSGAVPSSLAIDGDASDWAGALTPVPEEPGLSMGVRNSGTAMSVVLVANTPEQALRLSRGATFWFDGDGGTDRAFGIGFPLRPQRRAGGPRTRQPGDGPGAGPGGRDPGARMDRARERFNDGTRRLTVFRGGGGELQVGQGDVPGLDTAAEWTESALVVELRIPLAGDNGYAIGAAPGARVGMGLELIDVPEGGLRQRARRGGPGAGRGGRRGARPGAGGGARGDAGSRQLPTTTRWVQVTLVR